MFKKLLLAYRNWRVRRRYAKAAEVVEMEMAPGKPGSDWAKGVPTETKEIEYTDPHDVVDHSDYVKILTGKEEA